MNVQEIRTPGLIIHLGVLFCFDTIETRPDPSSSHAHVFIHLFLDPMKQKWIVFFSLFAFLFGCFSPTAYATQTPPVFFSEIAWAGSSLSAADEWIELTNQTSQPIDLSGWSLIGATSSPYVFPAESLIPSNGTFLLSNYAHTNSNSTLHTAPQIVTTLVSLPNDKLNLTLLSPQGSVVDSAGNGGAPFAGISGGTGSATDGRFRSMERRDPVLDGTTKDAWKHAEATQNLKTDVQDYATPGTHPVIIASVQIAEEPIITEVVPQEAIPICEDIVSDTEVVASSTETPPVNPPPSESQDAVPELQTEPVVSENTVPSPVTESQTILPQGTLQINELYSSPTTGESEWIEFVNPSNNSVSTLGWNVSDASQTTTLFPDQQVPAGGFILLENPKGKLNNDGDTVLLKNPNGVLVDSVTYSTSLGTAPAAAESLARTSTNTFALTTTPTKNSANVMTPRAVPQTNTTPTTPTESVPDSSATETSTTTTETTEQQPVTPPAPSPRTVRLSEMYANTGGSDATDEYIELENTGSELVSLAGWKLKDASGATFSFAQDAFIAPHTFKAFYRPQTKLSLNNDLETISLLAPDGAIVDTQSYAQAKTTEAYTRTNNLWYWTTTRTPNESNPLPGSVTDIQTSSDDGSGTSTNTSSTTNAQGALSASLLSISDVKQKQAGARVKIHGVVTALPNTFNSQTMYVQDETGGIQIFKSDCLFPTLVLGQSVTVTGVLSQINGEVRIKVTNQTTLTAGAVMEAVSPEQLSSDDEDSIGSLISIAGLITAKTGTRVAVNVNGETWNVDLPKSVSALYKPGATIQVSGILAKAKSGTVVKARSESDVTAVSTITEDTEAVAGSLAPSKDTKQTLALVLITLTSLAFIGLKLRPHLYALIESYGRKTPVRS